MVDRKSEEREAVSVCLLLDSRQDQVQVSRSALNKHLGKQVRYMDNASGWKYSDNGGLGLEHK